MFSLSLSPCFIHESALKTQLSQQNGPDLWVSLEDFLAGRIPVSVCTYQCFEFSFEISTKINENNLAGYVVKQLEFSQPEFEFT